MAKYKLFFLTEIIIALLIVILDFYKGQIRLMNENDFLLNLSNILLIPNISIISDYLSYLLVIINIMFLVYLFAKRNKLYYKEGIIILLFSLLIPIISLLIYNLFFTNDAFIWTFISFFYLIYFFLVSFYYWRD